MRAGTENVAGIAGFGAAAEAASRARLADAVRMAALRDQLRSRLCSAITPDAVIFGASAPRLPNTTLFAVPGLKAETAVIAFDLEGIAVSSGSACSSGKVAALARAGRHGRRRRTCARRGARQPWLCNHREPISRRFLNAWIKRRLRHYLRGQARSPR